MSNNNHTNDELQVRAQRIIREMLPRLRKLDKELRGLHEFRHEEGVRDEIRVIQQRMITLKVDAIQSIRILQERGLVVETGSDLARSLATLNRAVGHLVDKAEADLGLVE